MSVERFDRRDRREASERRHMADRRDMHRRVDYRRDAVRRITVMAVSLERRELSDRRMESRRVGPDRRSPEERRHGARRARTRRPKRAASAPVVRISKEERSLIASGPSGDSHSQKVYDMVRRDGGREGGVGVISDVRASLREAWLAYPSGASRARTGDPRLAKAVLSQLSYGP